MNMQEVEKMKYSEVGFRAFYHNFIVVPMKDGWFYT